MLNTPKQNKVAYIAGPITGRINENRGAFDDAASVIRKAGFIPVIPHDLLMHIDTTNYQWSDYLRICIAKICLHCDVMITLPDWESSAGAKLEVEVWRRLGNEPLPLQKLLSDAEAHPANPAHPAHPDPKGSLPTQNDTASMADDFSNTQTENV